MRRPRQGGQIFRATGRIYAENLLTFAAAGVIFVPVYLVAASIQWVIFHLTSVAPLVALDGRHGAVTAFLALLLGGVGGLFASVITTAAVAVILDERDTRAPHPRWSGLPAGAPPVAVADQGHGDRAWHGPPAHHHGGRHPIRDPSLHPLVAVRPGVHARRPFGQPLIAPQL
jgi:hypothetical protein